MAKVIYLPGCEPKEPLLLRREFTEYMITEILKEISDVFIEHRREMGPTHIWYEQVSGFLDEMDIPDLATKYSVEMALRDYKKYWREVMDLRIPNMKPLV